MDDALTLLGLMKKAGKLAIGADNVYEAAVRGKAKLLLTASDASPHVQRQMKRASDETQTPYSRLTHTKETLGAALGQNECAAAALTDKGFARAFCEKAGIQSEDAEKTEKAERGRPGAKPKGGKSKGGNC